jgi:hypothetical protein
LAHRCGVRPWRFEKGANVPFVLDEEVKKVWMEALALAARCEPFAAEADEMSVMHEPTLAELRKSGSVH